MIAQGRYRWPTRWWCGLLLGVLLLASPGAGAIPSKHVVFLLDRSGSMRSQCRKGRLQEVQRVAARMLGCIRDDGNVVLSFYRFGDRDRYQAILQRVSPKEALERLPELFTEQCDQYQDQRTFIAHSTFQIFRELLNRPEHQLSDPLPDEAGLFSFYVFTDGAEDTGNFDNEPYEKWMETQRRQNRVVLWLWDVTRQVNAPCPPGNRVLYLVQIGSAIPPDAARVDLEAPLASEPLKAQVSRRIVLYARDVMFAEDQEDPRLCRGEPSGGEPTPVPETTLHVQAITEWGLPGASGATPEWTVRAPARGLTTKGEIDRSSLELEILGDRDGETRIVVPSVAIQEGSAPIRLDRQQLCNELKRAYPFSDFLLAEEVPGETGPGPLPRLGNVLVERHPTYTFSLETQNGVPADRVLPALVSDRFHRYRTVSRTFRLVPPENVDAVTDWSVRVYRDGAPLANASDFVALSGEVGTRGTSISLPTSRNVEFSLPAEDRHPLWSLLGRGFHPPPGAYEVRLCVHPRLADGDLHAVRVTCPGCNPANPSQDGDTWCVPLPVEVKGRPLSWLALAGLALAILLALRILWRWKTRPRFPKGLRIGSPVGGEDLRTAHEKGITGILALYFRRPLYLELQGDGSTASWRQSPSMQGKRVAMNLLGVRPSPHGGHAIWCWCAGLERDETGTQAAEIALDGTTLVPLATEPRIGETRGLVPVDLRDLAADRKVVALHRKATNRVVEYPICLEQDAGR